MAQAVFTAQASDNYAINANTAPGPLFQCNLSGDQVPSNAAIQSATLTITPTYQFSALNPYKVTVDGTDATGALYGSGNSSSGNTPEPLNAILYTQLALYSGKSSLGIRVAGAGSGSQSVMSIRSGASITVTITYTVTEKATPPSSVALNKQAIAAGETATLSWSGATGGTLNTISGYQIQRSADGASWSAYKTVTTTAASGSTTVEPNSPGSSYRFRVITMGSGGVAYYSEPSAVVTLNTLTPTQATPPTALSISPALVEAATVSITVSGGQAGAGAAFWGYDLRWCESADGINWGAWTFFGAYAVIGTVYFTTNAPRPSARGMYRKYGVRTTAAIYGQYPDDSLASPWVDIGSCRYNRLPVVPTAGGISPAIVSTSPANVSVSWAGQSDPDGNLQGTRMQWQKLQVGGTWPATWTDYGSIVSGNGATMALSLGIGEAARVRVIAVDTLGAASNPLQISDLVYRSSGHPIVWTDNPIRRFETPIKAIHIMEMRGYINALRSLYGMSAIVWSSDIQAGITPMSLWRTHVQEIRAAINVTYTTIGWTLPSWAPITFANPTSEVMEQLRAQIVRL